MVVKTAETLRTALVLIASEYMKDCLKESKQSTIITELAKLEEAGLRDTKNAQILRSIREDEKPAKLVKEIKNAYPGALIVPYKDFFQVMKDYNLAVGRIDHYTGIIPEKNVQEIHRAAVAFKQASLSLNDMRYVSYIRLNSDLDKSVVNAAFEYFSRFPLITQDRSGVLRAGVHVSHNVSSYGLNSEDWLIAAPVADLPKNITIELYSKKAEDRRRIAQDPIVFKASRIGAVIVSMWGEEANSSIFDKYRQTP